MATEMVIATDPVAPSAKRTKTDELSDNDNQIVERGLKGLPASTLNGTDKWCPKTFGAMLEDPSTHDVTFKTSDGGSVSAHRVIVAAGSPVFHAMLYGNMKESNQKEIELPTVDSKTLLTLLTFVYTGTVNIDPQCVEKVLDATYYFNIAYLENQLIDFITKSLDITNIVDIALFANNSNFPCLFESCLSFMYHNADTVARDASFTRLSSDIVLKFCKSSELKIKEVVLFLAVDQWYKNQDQATEEAVVEEIFREIRYPLISEVDLVNLVRPLKMANPDLYTAALEYHLVPDKYQGPPNQLTKRRYITKPIKYISFNNVIVSDKTNSITSTNYYGFNNGICAVLVDPTEQQPVCFRVVIQYVNHYSHICFVTRSYNTRNPSFQGDDFADGVKLSDLCLKQEIDGIISVKGNSFVTTVNGTRTTTRKGILTYICVHMKKECDEFQFSFI